MRWIRKCPIVYFKADLHTSDILCLHFGIRFDSSTTSFRQTTVASYTLRRRNVKTHAALFDLGLPSTLIRHENRAIGKRFLNRRNLKNVGFAFHCRQRLFWKRSLSETMTSRLSRDFPDPISSNTNPNWPVTVTFSEWKRCFQISPAWTEPLYYAESVPLI